MRGGTRGHPGGAGAGPRDVVCAPAGVRGLMVEDERSVARVYVVCEPASHYYGVKVRRAWVPVLIGERI